MTLSKRITDTQFAKSADLMKQIEQVVKYLVTNRGVYIGAENQLSINQIKPIITTPITNMFEQCVATDYITEFATVYPIADKYASGALDSVPDLLTMNSITIDVKGVKEAVALQAYQEFNSKILINAASLIKLTDRGIHVSDINELHSMYVRGMLCRSFAQSNGWLNPNLCTYIIKCYSLLLSSVIARNENLSYPEQMSVASVFALYMSQLLMREDEDLTRPPLFYRSIHIGNRIELEAIATRCAPISGNGLTIASVCELIAELGPDRLSKYNPRFFYSACSALGNKTDIVSTHISFEYPPYFVHHILQSLSGMNFGIFSTLMKQHRLLDEGKRFTNELRVARTLYDNR